MGEDCLDYRCGTIASSIGGFVLGAAKVPCRYAPAGGEDANHGERFQRRDHSAASKVFLPR